MSSDSRHGTASVLTRRTAKRLRHHPQAAHALRTADAPFFFRDIDAIDTSLFQQLTREGVLKHAADHQIRTRLEDGTRWDAWRWELKAGVAEWIDRHVPVPEGDCPEPDCLSSGVRNLGDGDYTCTNDDCDSRFGRETAREVLDG